MDPPPFTVMLPGSALYMVVSARQIPRLPFHAHLRVVWTISVDTGGGSDANNRNIGHVPYTGERPVDLASAFASKCFYA